MEINKTWLAVEITVDSKASEAIEFALNELDALGTEINHLGKKQTETLCIVGYFNAQPDDHVIQTQLDEALRIYGFKKDVVKEISWREIENKDWLEEWKKHWRPTKVGKFIVAPTWSEIKEGGTIADSSNQEIVIRIDPEMAFGTGTHETTRLCLQAIEENYTSGMSFLDVGTGTGILAIAAAKIQSKAQSPKSKDDLNKSFLNFTSISACDTDENSIEIARKNAELNNVADDIILLAGSIGEETPLFDFVCANLTIDVILPILSLLIKKTRQKLVLSGILKEQESLIAEKFRQLQISDFKVQTDGEWISVLTNNGHWKTEN